MSPHTRSPLLSLALAVAVSTLACGDATGPVADENGTFSVTVTGSASKTFTGRAVFTPDVPGAEYGFAIALIDSAVSGPEPGVRHAVYLYREVDGAPSQGDHAIGAEGGFQAGVVLDGDGNDPSFCVAESGTVRLSTTTSTATRGSFTVQAVCYHLASGPEGDTISASGSFNAVNGTIAVPDDVTEIPSLSGRFELSTAAGSALPALVFDAVVPVGNDEVARLEITVTDGYLEFDETGAYEHRVTQQVRVDGQPAPALDWVDRGTCVASGADLTCLSTLVVNRAFTASVDAQAVEVTQDLNGEGVPVAYRYVRGG